MATLSFGPDGADSGVCSPDVFGGIAGMAAGGAASGKADPNTGSQVLEERHAGNNEEQTGISGGLSLGLPSVKVSSIGSGSADGPDLPSPGASGAVDLEADNGGDVQIRGGADGKKKHKYKSDSFLKSVKEIFNTKGDSEINGKANIEGKGPNVSARVKAPKLGTAARGHALGQSLDVPHADSADADVDVNMSYSATKNKKRHLSSNSISSSSSGSSSRSSMDEENKQRKKKHKVKSGSKAKAGTVVSVPGLKIKDGDGALKVSSAHGEGAIGGELDLPQIPLSVEGEKAIVTSADTKKRKRKRFPSFRDLKMSIGGHRKHRHDLGTDSDADIDVSADRGAGGHKSFTLPRIKFGAKHDDEFDASAKNDAKLRSKHGSLPDVSASAGSIDADIDDGPGCEAPRTGGKAKGRFQFPHFKFPSFRHKRKIDMKVRTPSADLDDDIEMKAPCSDVDDDIKLTGTSVSTPVPGLDVDMKGDRPDVDADIDVRKSKANVNLSVKDDLDTGHTRKGKGGGGFHITVPKIKYGSKGKVHGSHMDADAHRKIDVDEQRPDKSLKSLKGNVDVNLDGSFDKNAEFEGKHSGKSGFHIGMSKFRSPKFAFGGKGKRNVDADVGDSTDDVNFKGPDVDVKSGDDTSLNVSLDADSDLKRGQKAEGDLKLPKVKIPSFDFRLGGEGHAKGDDTRSESFDEGGGRLDVGGNIEIPNVKRNIKADTSDIDMDADGKLEAQSIDADLQFEERKGGFHINMPKIKGPKFGFKGDILDAGAEVDIKGSKDGSDVKASFVDVDVGIDAESEVGGRVQVPKFKAFKFSLGGNAEVPDVDVDIDVQKIDAGRKIEVDAPQVDMNAERHDVDIGGDASDVSGDTKGGFNFHMPKFKLPKLGFGDTGKADIDIDADVDVKRPKVEVGFDAPDKDIKKKSGGGFQINMHKMKGPKFSFGGKGKGDSDYDVDVKGPKNDIYGGATYDDVDVVVPDVDVDGKVHMPKLKSAKVNFGGKGEREIDADIEMNEQINVNVEGSDVNIQDEEKSGAGFVIHMPKIKGPKFDLGDKGKREIDVDADIDAEGSKVAEDVDVGASDVEFEGPKVNVNLDADHDIGKKKKVPTATLR